MSRQFPMNKCYNLFGILYTPSKNYPNPGKDSDLFVIVIIPPDRQWLQSGQGNNTGPATKIMVVFTFHSSAGGGAGFQCPDQPRRGGGGRSEFYAVPHLASRAAGPAEQGPDRRTGKQSPGGATQ